MFQVCIGEIVQGSAAQASRKDIAWFCILDFFCLAGKNIPDQEDFAACLHIACSEVKGSGMEDVVVIARATQSPIGDRKRAPGLFPAFTLKRFGFSELSQSNDTLEQSVLRQMQQTSQELLHEHNFPLMAVTIAHDSSEKRVSRWLPVSPKDGKPLFIWDRMCLTWAESTAELTQRRQR